MNRSKVKAKAKATTALSARELSDAIAAQSQDEGRVSLAAQFSKKAQFKSFKTWVIGDTPLITHAWSEKARREMLSKQVKAVKVAKEARDPHEDYKASLYPLGDGTYGFPAMGFKNCLLQSAHKDRGIPRTDAMAGLWIDAQMVRTRPALTGAICDMPLLRIYGSDPVMREDMVRVGSGLNKTATLAFRAQFTVWACRLQGKFNAELINEEQLAFLINTGGTASGVGEWRNERRGMFGAFHLASTAEEQAWEKFANGRGPLPVPEGLQQVQLAEAAE